MQINKELMIGAWAVTATVFSIVLAIESQVKDGIKGAYKFSAQSTIIEEDLRELCPESASKIIKKLRRTDVENMNRE